MSSVAATCALGEPRVLCEGDVHVFLVSLSMSFSSNGGGSVVVAAVGFVASGGRSRESSSTSLRLPWLEMRQVKL